MNDNSKLEISFPKSSEDHRLQLVGINGAIFAIIDAPLESKGPIRLHCEEWSLILLAPIKSQSNILVSAINVICLNEIESEEGNVNIHASNRLVKLVKSDQAVSEMGECGEFICYDNPGLLLYYHKLFHAVLNSIKDGKITEAQNQFITSLCTLADQIEGKPQNLDIKKVLSIWKIPIIK